jgi:hypothetical protein
VGCERVCAQVLVGKISECAGEAYRGEKVVKKMCVMLLARKLFAQIII